MKRTLLLTAVLGLFSVIPGVSGSGDQITICHVPPGNPENVQIITVGAAAVPTHLGNHVGDSLYIDGSCGTSTVEG